MNLRCKNIDIENKAILLETTKNGKPRNEPCIGSALNTILEFHKPESKPLNLLFPSPSNSQNPYDIQKAWKAVLKRSGK